MIERFREYLSEPSLPESFLEFYLGHLLLMILINALSWLGNGYLILLHIYLQWNGMSTYDYIVKLRQGKPSRPSDHHHHHHHSSKRTQKHLRKEDEDMQTPQLAPEQQTEMVPVLELRQRRRLRKHQSPSPPPLKNYTSQMSPHYPGAGGGNGFTRPTYDGGDFEEEKQSQFSSSPLKSQVQTQLDFYQTVTHPLSNQAAFDCSDLNAS